MTDAELSDLQGLYERANPYAEIRHSGYTRVDIDEDDQAFYTAMYNAWPALKELCAIPATTSDEHSDLYAKAKATIEKDDTMLTAMMRVDPRAVLALIDEVRRLRAENALMHSEHELWNVHAVALGQAAIDLFEREAFKELPGLQASVDGLKSALQRRLASVASEKEKG